MALSAIRRVTGRTALAGLAALTGCQSLTAAPTGKYDYDFMFAESVCARCPPSAWPGDLSLLSLPELYAVHRYGMTLHPWRLQTAEFVRRGASTAGFLRERIVAVQDPGAVWSILQIFLALQEAGAYDAASDPELMSALQQKATKAGNWSRVLLDEADELALRERFPSGVSIGTPQTPGQDYDHKFARDFCAGCDYREIRERAQNLPIDRLYAVQRYGWENFYPPVVLDPLVASRGAAAALYLKDRLRVRGSSAMIWNILNTFLLARDTGAYDARDDAELMALIARAGDQATGSWGPSIREMARLLLTGETSIVGLKSRAGYRLDGPGADR